MLGVRRVRLLRRHMLPNIAEPLLITGTVAVGDALLALAGLSFLGLGVQPPQIRLGPHAERGSRPDLRDTDRAPSAPRSRSPSGRSASCCSARCSPRRAAGERRPHVEALRASCRPPAGGAGRRRRRSRSPFPRSLAVEDLTVSFPGGSVPVRAVSLEVAAGRDRRDRRRVRLRARRLTAMAIARAAPARGPGTAARLQLFGQRSADARRFAAAARCSAGRSRSSSRIRCRPSTPRCVSAASWPRCRRSTRASPEVVGDAAAVDRLGAVRIANPAARVRQYPHEFSGGMRQRADDRDGPDERAEADHRRRADDRPRRHGAAADPASCCARSPRPAARRRS